MRTEADTPQAQEPVCGPRGFTLVEIMIVLAVMSLILAFAAPRMAGNLLGLTLETTAKKIAGALRYARSQALNTGITHAAIFDTEQNRLIIAALIKPSAGGMPAAAVAAAAAVEEAVEPEPAEGRLPKQDIKTYPLPEEVRFETIAIGGELCKDSGGNDICQMVFFPDGTTQGGEIIIADTKQRTYSIDINFLTGIVSLEEQTQQQ